MPTKNFFFNIITITFAGVHLLGGLSREGFIFILKKLWLHLSQMV